VISIPHIAICWYHIDVCLSTVQKRISADNILPNAEAFKKQTKILCQDNLPDMQKNWISRAFHSIDDKNEPLFIGTEKIFLRNTRKLYCEWIFSLLVVEMKVTSMKLLTILCFELHGILLIINRSRRMIDSPITNRNTFHMQTNTKMILIYTSKSTSIDDLHIH